MAGPEARQVIDAIASNKLGAPPAAAAPAAAPPQGMAPPQAPQAKPAAPASPSEKASETASPATEADRMRENPVTFEFEHQGSKRTMSPEQISSLLDRYSTLNYQNMQNKPILDLVGALRKQNPNMSAKDIADRMMNLASGGQQVTKQDAKDANKEPENLEQALAKWEKDNAASLPPGYKEMIMSGGKQNQAIMSQLAQTQRMLQAVLAQSQGVADAAKAGMQGGNDARTQAIRGAISNNLDAAQAKLQLPDDKANEFMIFAAERGYSMEDFIDPNLTLMVMNDYKNNMNAPEMERLRGIHSRRQAWTGSLATGAPGGPTAASTAESNPLNSMIDSVMAKKMI